MMTSDEDDDDDDDDNDDDNDDDKNNDGITLFVFVTVYPGILPVTDGTSSSVQGMVVDGLSDNEIVSIGS